MLHPPQKKCASGTKELFFKNLSDINIANSTAESFHKEFKTKIFNPRHATVAEAYAEFKANKWKWKDYYKFTFTRNPWHRYISYLNMAKKLNKKRYLLTFSNKINMLNFLFIKKYRNTTQDEYFNIVQNFMGFHRESSEIYPFECKYTQKKYHHISDMHLLTFFCDDDLFEKKITGAKLLHRYEQTRLS